MRFLSPSLNIKRYKKIVSVLFKYGFGSIFEGFHSDHFLGLKKKSINSGYDTVLDNEKKRGVRLRKAFEELGPTFIKLGQILSLRPEIVPIDIINELKKLTDDVPPFPADEAISIIEAELGKPISELFAFFDKDPIAAASISQVHRAKLFTGEDIVVKVQRPHITDMIDTDLVILKNIAKLLERYSQDARIYKPVKVVNEFQKSISDELFFLKEGKNADSFKRQFADDPTVHIPKVYWDYSSDKVLTLEFISGVPLTEVMKNNNMDMKLISKRCSENILRQIFDFGIFHADPHPGNIFIMEDYTIAFVDFGMVGKVNEDVRHLLADILLSVIDRDSERIFRIFLLNNIIDTDLNTVTLKNDISDFIDNYYNIPINQIKLKDILHDFSVLVNEYKVQIATSLFILIKALVTLEGILLELDPSFKFNESVFPYFKKIIASTWEPTKISKRYLSLMKDFLSVFPKDMYYFINRLKRGHVNISLNISSIDQLIKTLNRVSNRMTFGLVITGLLVASSIMINNDRPIFFLKVYHLAMFGFLVSVIMVLVIFISMFRR